MAEQPVVKTLLLTEFKSLQVKLSPHQEQYPETKSNLQKLNSSTQALKVSREKEILNFFCPKYRGLGIKSNTSQSLNAVNQPTNS